ncbi:hypothetical protein ONQ60_25660, partial [Salmonella enterica subsp. enterica serovar Virginia]|nr:hypothetical protein [Salmonella enterica subsp. enterica serovar Virginia]
EVIARYASADVERISAVTSGVKEIREAIERARQNRNAGRRTIRVMCWSAAMKWVKPQSLYLQLLLFLGLPLILLWGLSAFNSYV